MSRAEFYRMVSAAIAWSIDHHANTVGQREGMQKLARELAHRFGTHNSKFDATRFLRDSGAE